MVVKLTFKHNDYKVAIVEDPKRLLETCNLTRETIGSLDLDTRILTNMFTVENGNNDYEIVVYDYAKIDEDQSIKEAIIHHELGHIVHPGFEFKHELECDKYAMEIVGVEAVFKMLCMAHREVEKLGVEHAIAFLTARKGYAMACL